VRDKRNLLGIQLRISRRPLSTEKGTEGDEYERKTPHEHVLLRPGMYIGQVAPSATEGWVYDASTAKMTKKSLNYSPALLKLFDEILVNAADNAQRKEEMSKIDVKITESDGGGVEICIRNDGQVIPIVKHSKENIYIPELIFGNLLTGSNFDDSKDAFTGGRHGYGAKLTNIFSNKFSVEMYDSATSTLYKQQWSDNMLKCAPPTLEKMSSSPPPPPPPSSSSSSSSLQSGGGNYLEIKFSPDLHRLGLDAQGVRDWLHEKQRRIDEGKERVPSLTATGTALVSPLQDTLDMMRKRVLDVAACVGTDKMPIHVSLNGEVVPVTSFRDYVGLFHQQHQEQHQQHTGDDVNFHAPRPALFTTTANKHWEVAVMGSVSGSFDNQSFVNSVWTPRGGTHVAVVTSQIVNAIEEALIKQGQTSSTPHMIRNRLMIFVKAKVANPSFDSQAKDALSTPPGKLMKEGGNATQPLLLSPSFLKKVVTESGIVEEIMMDLEARERSKLVRASSVKGGMQRNLAIPKLEDALFAGSQRGGECSLILTEGDSAKALAVAGLEEVGRERYGVLPLRGKILNVRGVSASVLNKNAELMNLVKALGLEFGKKYTGSMGHIRSVNDSEGGVEAHMRNGVHGQGLRYGKVLIMTDQDHDGSHIKGLLINFFHTFWPSLLNVEGFLQQFITPLVKVKKRGGGGGGVTDVSERGDDMKGGKKTRNKSKSKGDTDAVRSFYSLPEYEAWQQQQERDGASGKYQVKYYKGLGTNTAAEGRAYFAQLDSHRKLFWSADRYHDPNSDSETGRQIALRDADSVDLAFSKHRAADRKSWLESSFDPTAFVDPYKKEVSVAEFINTDLMQFSHADNVRSIPSVIDGLKPSQRKVLYGCLKKKGAENETKVVQLAGYIAEQTAYHHGEGSLHATIVNMAQDYVGSNNVPLLLPGGQFGTRAQGGKDYASPRYIFTSLSPLTRLMFPEADESNLRYEQEDGLVVEPSFYVPVLPNLLINGSYGIGTGWSCYVPQHDPLAVAEHVLRLIRGESISQISPLVESSRKGAIIPPDLDDPSSSRLRPWVRGFRGHIHRVNDGRGITYKSAGQVRRTSGTTIDITELPVGMWTDDYKQHLLTLYENGAIKRFHEYHTADRVHFEVTGTKVMLDALEQPLRRVVGRPKASKASTSSSKEGKSKAKSKRMKTDKWAEADIQEALLSRFKLEAPMSLRNMHAFDAAGKIVKYSSAEEICEAHYTVRLAAYEARKDSLLRKYRAEVALNGNKSRFVSDILNGHISLLQSNSSEDALVGELISRGYASREEIDGALLNGQPANGSGSGGKAAFRYLLDMPINSLTEERVVALKKSSEESTQRLTDMEGSAPSDLWVRDVEAYVAAASKLPGASSGKTKRK
jgi:DNA topoisomerase-2